MPPAPSAPSRQVPRVRRAAGPVLAGLALAALAPVVGSGCFFTNEGLSPPTEAFYYPTGLVVSPNRTALYVADSDFDLQFNGGTVQVLDLAAIREKLGGMLPAIVNVLATPLTMTPADLRSVCNAIHMSLPTAGATGAACTAPNDCASGYCVIGSDGVDGTCAACAFDYDCPGGGRCQVALCKSDGTTVCNTKLDCPDSLNDTCAPTTPEQHVCVLDIASNQGVTPAVCSPIAPPFKGFATIGAFASGAVLALNPTGAGARLFVPVRGDPSITWFDVADDRFPSSTNPYLLDCGAADDGVQRCNDDHRMGVNPYENFRDLTLPVEPVGLDVSNDGTSLVSAHQIQGGPAVGLSSNSWTAGQNPSFDYYLTGVAAGPSEVAHIDPPALVAAEAKLTGAQGTAPVFDYQPAFLVTYNATPEVDVVRVDDDRVSNPPRPFLQVTDKALITVNASGTDSIGVAVDSSQRRACEAACCPSGPGSCDPSTLTSAVGLSCLGNCIDTPLDVFIANRSPPTLLIGQVQTTLIKSGPGPIAPGSSIIDEVQIFTTAPVNTGPSKVVIGDVLNAAGVLESRVFVVTFDSHQIFVFDPQAPQSFTSVIATGRGPHAVAFDACCDATAIPGCGTACGADEKPHAYLYVGHFTDSYLGVVDLDMSHGLTTFGSMFASIGVPLAPLESQ
jgi:hypothetical protein